MGALVYIVYIHVCVFLFGIEPPFQCTCSAFSLNWVSFRVIDEATRGCLCGKISVSYNGVSPCPSIIHSLLLGCPNTSTVDRSGPVLDLHLHYMLSEMRNSGKANTHPTPSIPSRASQSSKSIDYVQPPAALDWDGPDDELNPHNWKPWKRWFGTLMPGILCLVVYVSGGFQLFSN